MQVRRLRPSDIEAVSRLTADVFFQARDEERDGVYALVQAAYRDCPFMPPELCWVGEVDGRPVAKWQVLDFEVRIGTTPIRVGGIQGVVAEPDANHKGYARAIALEALPQVAQAGFDAVIGFAQRGGFYSRLGTVPLMAEYDVSMDPRGIPAPRKDPFVPFTPERLPELIAFSNRANAARSGSLVRSEALWPWLIRKPDEYYIADDGYFGIRRTFDRIEIRDVGGEGPAFHDAAIRKLCQLGREDGLTWVNFQLPPDHPLSEAALRYGARLGSSYAKKSGCIGMLLRPHAVLEKVAPELETRIEGSALRGRPVELEVSVAGERRTHVLGAAHGAPHRASLSLDPGPLLQLLMGLGPPSPRLHREVHRADGAPLDAETLRVCEVLFPESHPFMSVSDRY